TAAMDTTEDDIENLFSNLSDKSPESLLRRINPNQFYPVYGDDSTFVEDAPTQGRFYVRIEDGNDYLLWGNFLSSVQSSDLAQLDRGLYGAKAVVQSDTATSHGENRYTAVGFAADPGTIPAREEFLATGGSVYFLENQDITIGSERVRLEVRDQDTGFVQETVELVPHVDYTVDYIRGRILLSRPVSAIALGDTVVREGALSGNAANLVVRYEYSPGLTEIDGFTLGGRAEAWATDGLRVGVTGQREETADADQTLLAADLTARRSADTYARVEVARTDGAAFTERRSLDGGFTYQTVGENLSTDEAYAYHLEGAVGFADIFGEERDGRITAYYENFEAGYAGAGRITEADTERFGVRLATTRSNAARFMAEIDRLELAGLREETTLNVDYTRDLFGKWGASVGARYSDVDDMTGSPLGSGERVDLGVQLDYQLQETIRLYGFGQATLSADGTRPDNNRLGLGADAQVNDRLSVRGEVSEGDGGFGASVGAGYRVREGEEYYLNYALDNQRTSAGDAGRRFGSNGQNTVTLGGRKRFNDQVSVYGEERASFGDSSGLTHAFGVDLAPFENWSFGASLEVGDLEEFGNVIEREGYTATVGYSTEDVTLGGAFEWIEDTNNGAQRETWLLRSNLGYKVNPDWRALIRYNKAESNFSGGAFFDGDFTEFQVAGAYRPVDNNRVNALLRYTYYEDLPGAEQISNSGSTALPAQKSNVFSLDGNVRVADWLTLGGKVGYREGELSLSRVDEEFVDSEASLLIGRADVHFVKKWDALAEIRTLDVDTAGNSETGALFALYRHFGDNAKVGLGYNFTDFSDDLTDLSYDDSGLFLNLVAKY
ncbi:MAG: flagellar motor protein MotB, partial [Pseudomonadota bacterium]